MPNMVLSSSPKPKTQNLLLFYTLNGHIFNKMVVSMGIGGQESNGSADTTNNLKTSELHFLLVYMLLQQKLHSSTSKQRERKFMI